MLDAQLDVVIERSDWTHARRASALARTCLDSLERRLQDRVLDLYLDWKKTGEADLRTRIDELIKEIRSLYPHFNFKLPDA